MMRREKPRAWVEVATAARRTLERSHWGDREQTLASVASRAGLDAQTVRRAVSALDFLDHLGQTHDDIANGIRIGGSVAAVEHLARWSKHDRDGAIAAAREYLRGVHTVRSLGGAELDARRRGNGGRLSKGPDLRSKIESRVSEWLGNGWMSKERPAFRDWHEPIVDIIFKGPGRTIAVLIVGPYGHRTMYAKRRVDWLLRAAGIAYILRDYDIILALPDEADPLEWNQWIRFHEAGDRIRIFSYSARAGGKAGADDVSEGNKRRKPTSRVRT